ncbi:MAG: mechanosensitive ion channel family protein [Moorea sp. SIO2B7]|nr:mechanosensitive ion channel family protein [Moorena sp. SIO2B7]
MINIVTIVAEIVLFFIFLFLFDWFFDKLYRQVLRISLLQQRQNTLAKMHSNIRGFLFICAGIVVLIIIGVNVFLAYRGENVRDYSLNLIRQIPKEFWKSLALGIIKSIGVIIGVSIFLRKIDPLIDKFSKYLQKLGSIDANDESIADFFKTFKNNINSAAWIAIAILCAQFLILPSIVTKYLYILLQVYLIIAIGLLIFNMINVVIDSVDAISIKYYTSDYFLRIYNQLRHLIPFLKRCLEYIIYVFIATLVVQKIAFIANLSEWGTVGIKLIAITLMSRIIISVSYLVVEELLLNNKNLKKSQQQRRQTITPLIQSSFKYLIYFGAGIFTLDAIGINPGPILAGAGIVGFAIGLGTQNLLNDIVSGFFILFENYYLVGDYIETDEASGYVESIELRTTRIRHSDGQLYILRNGDISSITNYSKDYVYAVVHIGVDYDTNLDQVYEIIETIGHQLKEENSNILEPTKVEGIEEFGDIRLSIKTKTKVKPGKHSSIRRIVRKMLKQAFDREGIYIPIGETTNKPEWVTQGKKGEQDNG